jgi:hypothetical protein
MGYEGRQGPLWPLAEKVTPISSGRERWFDGRIWPNAEALRLPHLGSFPIKTGHSACMDHCQDH